MRGAGCKICGGLIIEPLQCKIFIKSRAGFVSGYLKKSRTDKSYTIPKKETGSPEIAPKSDITVDSKYCTATNHSALCL